MRRKGSKIVRLSVFEGRSTQDISRHTGPKRLSDDGETLGSTLARLKVDKRKAATPLIGELSFENDEPVKARTQTGSSTKRSPDPQTFSQAPLSSANVAAYAATTVGVSGRTERGPALANLACAASAYVSGALDKPPSNLNQNTTGYPFPSVPASLPPVPMVTMRGFAPKGSPGTGLPALPSVPGSVLSTFSVMSASRANILGAQMRGAQMLGASQSNISIASNRSAASPKRTRIKQGTHQQSPYPATHSRKPSQATPARTPLTQPMSRVEDNFISMTPARSDMSIKSARSLDREQREHMPEQFQAQSKAQAYYQATPSSLLTHPVLPEEMRASYRMKNAMRPSTAPLPPLPSDVASVNPLPLRTTGGLETADLSQSRLSTHRPLKPLTVDTDAAKEQARLQRLAKQALAEQKQKLMMQQGSDRTAVNPHSLATEARDLDEMQMQMQMPFKPTKQVPGRFEAEDAPKTGNSFSEKMSAIFTPPKRPFRKDSGPELPLRVPRPPSAGPVDLSHFATNNAGNRQSTTSTSASSTQSKSKGMKLFGGLSKIRKVGQPSLSACTLLALTRSFQN